MDKLIELLNARRGKWPEIARLADVDFSTLCRIANGTTKSPRYETVQSLISAARKVKANDQGKGRCAGFMAQRPA